MVGECLTSILALAVFLGISYILRMYVLFPKDRELRNKGYRERFTGWGNPSYYEPDPTRKGVIPDETWKARGYRWSEKYKRWYKPKKPGNS